MAISTIVRRATLALVLWLLALSAFASGIAIVTDLQGRTMRSNADRSAEAGILSDLEAGLQAQLAANASLVVLYLADGREYQIKGPAQVVFRADRPEVRSGAPAARRPAPATGSLQTAEVSGTTFRVPAGLALREGNTCTWEVSAHGTNERKYSARGECGLANAALRAQVVAARSQAVAEVSCHVALVLWLEQQALRDDVCQVWRELAQQRPAEAQLRAMAER